jgi:hypothetical protein
MSISIKKYKFIKNINKYNIKNYIFLKKKIEKKKSCGCQPLGVARGHSELLTIFVGL